MGLVLSVLCRYLCWFPWVSTTDQVASLFFGQAPGLYLCAILH